MLDANLYDLATKLQDARHIERMKLLETTTMSAITYLPAHLGMVRAKVKDLIKKKRKWGLEILEDDDGNKDVRIEDALRIIVPREHWDSFQSLFVGRLDNDVYLNLDGLLNEAMEDELRDLRTSLKPALFEMYNERRFTTLDKTIKVWQGRFGIGRIITDKNKVAVVPEHKGRSIHKLWSKLLRAYGEDKGGLEMLINDMKRGRPLSAYDVFKEYDCLYGTRIVSELHDVTLIFEATIDTAFMTSESIYVSDETVLGEDVLEEVEDRIVSVKRVGNVLYPTNEKFDVGFFGTLYSIIEEVMEEQEKEER